MIAKNKLSWQIPSHTHSEKSGDWFIALGVLSVSVFIVAILFKNFFFAILVVVATVTIWALAKQKPKKINCTLSESGIKIGFENYAWEDLLAFCIKKDETETYLLIDTKKTLSPHLLIPVPGYLVQDVEKFLTKYIEEKNLQEPFSHQIIRFLGF